MRGISLAFSVIAMTAAAVAQPSVAVSPSSIDFGQVGPRALDSSVTITNRGSEPLVIESVSTSCGCTSAPFARRELKAGESTTVPVTVDARRKHGNVRTSMTIVTSDPKQKQVTVGFAASVVRAVDVTEVAGPAQGAAVGMPHEVEITMRNVGTEAVRFHSPSLTSSVGVTVDLRALEVSVPAGETRTVRIPVTPEKAGVGSAMLALKTTSPLQPEVTVGLYTNVPARAER